MGIKFANNAFSTLASDITSGATLLTVAAGDGAKFPVLGGGDYFRATIVSGSNMEIVKVTARASDVFTIVRAEESTLGLAWLTGANVSLYITNQDLVDLVNERQALVTATGVLKGTGSAVVTATAGTDYLAPPTGTAIQKAANGAALANAVAGTDYLAPPAGTAIQKANNSAALVNAVAGTDYAAVYSITGMVKSAGTVRSQAMAGTDYLAPYGSQTANFFFAAPNGSAGAPSFRAIAVADIPTLNQATTGSAAKWTTARLLAGNSVDGSANVPFANKYIVQGTIDSGLSGAQFLGSLGTGVLKNTTSTGVLSIAVAGTDFAPVTSGSVVLKGNGAGGFASAVSGTDYLAPPAGTAIQKANNSGALANAIAGTDYIAPYTAQTANLFLASPNGASGVPTFRAIVAADIPASGSASKWTTPRLLANNSVDGSADVPFANKFIVQGTADAGLSGAQFMGAQSTGLVKNTTGTGVLSIAVPGTDYVSSSGTEVVSNKTLTNATIVTAGSAGAVTAANASTPLRVESIGSGNEAYIAFLIPGVYGVGFGIDSSGQFNVGGWSLGGNKYKVWTARDSYAWTVADASHINSGSYAITSPQIGVGVVCPAPFTFYNNGMAWGMQWLVPPSGFFGSNLYYSSGWKFIHNYGYGGYLGMDGSGGIGLSITNGQSTANDSAASVTSVLYINQAGVVTVGDVVTQRSNDSGVVYLGNTKGHYLYFDGVKFQIFGGPTVTASSFGVACSGSPLSALDVQASNDRHFSVGLNANGNVSLGVLNNAANAWLDLSLTGGPYVYPTSDNSYYLGSASYRWNTVFAVSGTINTSDERLKTDIQDSVLGLDFVEALRPVSYKWIVGVRKVTREPDGEEIVPESIAIDGTVVPATTRTKYKDVVTDVPGVRPHWGLIAQDVHSAMKAKGIADFGGFVLEDPLDANSTQSLRYDEFIAPMIKAIQELSAKVKALEAQLAAK